MNPQRRNTHRRGHSQQIPRFNKSKDKDYLDFKCCHVFSSQHTRSTAITYKNSNISKKKQKKPIKPITDHPNHNKQQPNISSNMPCSPKYILQYHSQLLQPQQQEQIREYQNIYYIGQHRKAYNKIPGTLGQDHEIFYRYRLGDHIAYRYEIVDAINHGSFGEVIKVYDHKSKEYQALKIVKKMPELIKQTFIEISILTAIKEKDREDLSGIVRIKDFTIFRDHICIFFELLEANLYQLMYSNDFKGLQQSFARVFAIQILNSLNFLHRHKIIHCDIKLENVVLKVWGKSGIKLVDFGTSCYESQQVYTYIQSRYYRAPEILFQHQYTCAIDMWSFGCMIAELCLGQPLFPGKNNLHQLLYIIALLGFPELEWTNECRKQVEKLYVYLERDQYGQIKEEKINKFEEDTGLKVERECLMPLEKRLGKNHVLMIHFLNQILKWNPNDRITPAQALQHPWILQGLPKQMRQLHTIHQSLDMLKNNNNNIIKKPNKTQHKRKTSKNSSKSKSKSRQNKSNNSAQHKKKVFHTLAHKNILKNVTISPYLGNYKHQKSVEKSKEQSKLLKKKNTDKQK